MFLLNGCASDANFTVSLTWNSGLSSYDSKSGTLIKDCMANDPTNFTTALHLSDAQMDARSSAGSTLRNIPPNMTRVQGWRSPRPV